MSNAVFMFGPMLWTEFILHCWSFLLFVEHIGAVMEVKINYVNGWKSSYITAVAANQLLLILQVLRVTVVWHHNRIIRFVFLQVHLHVCVVMCLSINFRQCVTHSCSVMYVPFYVTCWGAFYWSYFWLGCVLGGELRMMYGYYETKWVELAALVQLDGEDGCDWVGGWEAYDEVERFSLLCWSICMETAINLKYCRMSSASTPISSSRDAAEQLHWVWSE